MSAKLYLTEDDYLAMERVAESKSEYFAGEVLIRAHVNLRHSVITGNLFAELAIRSRGGPCRVFTSDLRVHAKDLCVYPDISVVRSKPLPLDSIQDNIFNPVLLCEIVAPATAALDRGRKWRGYRTIESLEEYVLVEQDSMLVEHYTRQADNVWKLRDYRRPEDELRIDSIGVAVPLARIYDGVEFAA